MKEVSGEGGIYTSENLPQNMRIATEIESTCVSVAKLLVLPVWGSFCFRFVPDDVLHSRTVSTQVEVHRVHKKLL